MNMRKVYRPGLVLGATDKKLRRKCEHDAMYGPCADHTIAMAILEELDKEEERKRREREVDDKLDRAIHMISGRRVQQRVPLGPMKHIRISYTS